MTTAAADRRATVPCPFCATLNRVDLAKLADGPRCGSCGRPILLDRPVAAADATLDQVLTGSDVPVLVDFYADWCGPCKIMAPLLDDVARERSGRLVVIKLDTDRNQASAMRYGIRSIPTLVVFRQGREAGRQVGGGPRAALDTLIDRGAA